MTTILRIVIAIAAAVLLVQFVLPLLIVLGAVAKVIVALLVIGIVLWLIDALPRAA